MEPSELYFVLQSLFLTRDILNTPGENIWQELFKSSRGIPFDFLISTFQNLGLKVASFSTEVGTAGTLFRPCFFKKKEKKIKVFSQKILFLLKKIITNVEDI